MPKCSELLLLTRLLGRLPGRSFLGLLLLHLLHDLAHRVIIDIIRMAINIETSLLQSLVLNKKSAEPGESSPNQLVLVLFFLLKGAQY